MKHIYYKRTLQVKLRMKWSEIKISEVGTLSGNFYEDSKTFNTI